jgi:hypothetical protein
MRVTVARLVVDTLFIASRPLDVVTTVLHSLDWALYRIACSVDRWGGEPEEASLNPLTLAEWLDVDEPEDEDVF